MRCQYCATLTWSELQPMDDPISRCFRQLDRFQSYQNTYSTGDKLGRAQIALCSGVALLMITENKLQDQAPANRRASPIYKYSSEFTSCSRHQRLSYNRTRYSQVFSIIMLPKSKSSLRLSRVDSVDFLEQVGFVSKGDTR